MILTNLSNFLIDQRDSESLVSVPESSLRKYAQLANEHEILSLKQSETIKKLLHKIDCLEAKIALTPTTEVIDLFS